MMLPHDFIDMQGKDTMLLRCRWCYKQPSKAREDGCPVHELEEMGTIQLCQYNPEGVEYFKGRNCLTCELPIMGHWLRKGYDTYWCYANQNQFSEGIDNCVYDVKDIDAPVEPTL